MTSKQELIQKAEQQVQRYPQYKGHFDDYVLVRVRRNIKTKMGLSFIKDELTIANPKIHCPEFGPLVNVPFVTVWSSRNAIDTSIKKKDVTFLE